MSGAGFILDLGRCVGCGACALACRLENGWPEGVAWRRVLSLNRSRYAGGPTYHFSVACHHCERPACLAACPSGAYRKRSDGVVLLDSERCLGCRYCEMACPFGAPSYDKGHGVVTKCDLCSNRLDIGLLPACVAACPTEALALRKTGEVTAVREEVPGFSDPAGCCPNTTLLPPRGRIRSLRLNCLLEALRERAQIDD